MNSLGRKKKGGEQAAVEKVNFKIREKVLELELCAVVQLTITVIAKHYVTK